MDVVSIIAYYWPRFIAAILFTGFSAVTISQKHKGLALFWRTIIAFFTSCIFVSIVTELFITFPIKNNLLPLLGYNEPTSNAIFAQVYVICDLLSYIIPVIIFSKLIGEKPLVAATIYMEYILQDKFAMVLSVSAVSYLVIYFLELIILAMIHKNDLEYIFSNNTAIRWEPVFYYNLALLVLMDICYSAVYIFPELSSDTISFPTFWLDTIIIIASLAAAGFSKLNVLLSKEHSKKIDYMRKFQDNQTDIIRDFATISEAKSGETGQHIRRVSEYTAILAKDIFPDETEISYIKVAAMMHDIGKLMIPNEIIEKPGKLSPDEYETIKTHSQYGDSLLSHSEGEIMSIARTIAYEHHERWDGKGYPRGLKGEDISLYAQIVSVADVYDALTSKRSYKDAWDPAEAKAEIVRQRGHQFSPQIVDIFNTRYKEIEKIRMTYTD